MGYLLKTEEKIKMFYSEPQNGCYADDIMMVGKEEYDNHYSKTGQEFVFLTGWHDTSAELHSKESLGIEITNPFIIDCILQGENLQENELFEF